MRTCVTNRTVLQQAVDTGAINQDGDYIIEVEDNNDFILRCVI